MSFDIPREFAADCDVSDELWQVFRLGRGFIGVVEAEWLWPEEAPLADHFFEKRVKDLIESKFESVDELYRLAKQAYLMSQHCMRLIHDPDPVMRAERIIKLTQNMQRLTDFIVGEARRVLDFANLPVEGCG